jgi:gluconolactonase
MIKNIEFNVIANELGFPEGPVYKKDGSIMFVELRNQTVKQVNSNGQITLIANCGGSPNGLAIGPDGAAYICNNGGSRFVEGSWRSFGAAENYKGGFIQRIDLQSGDLTTLYSECNGERLSSPNDLIFDKQGGFYFTDIGKTMRRHREHGGVYYAMPDGSNIEEIIYPILSPNGIGLSPDEEILYVAETETGRLWAFDIKEPGHLHKHSFPSPHGGRLLHGLDGFQRLDSLAVDIEGNICVGTLMTGFITVISPQGELLYKVKFPDTYPTNICFGGHDMKTAFVTLSETGQLVSLEWPTPGLKLNFSI